MVLSPKGRVSKPRMEIMSFPDLEVSTVPILSSDADAILLALPVLDSDSPAALADWPGVRDALLATGFTGAASSFQRVYAPDSTALPLAVVGTGADPDAAAVRDAVGAGIRLLTGFARVSVAVVDSTPELSLAAAEGAALGGYRFSGYKSEAPKARATTVIVHSAEEIAPAALAA